MRVRDLLTFVVQSLRGHGVRTGLSLGAVAVGVVAVVLLTSLGEGARTYVRREFLSLGTNLLIVLPGRTETTGLGGAGISVGTHDLTLGDVAALQHLARVRRIAPLTVGRATVKAGVRTRDVLVVGTTAEYRHIRGIVLGTGTYLAADGSGVDGPDCVLGSTVARELFGVGNPLGRFMRIGEERCRVVGVTASRGTSLGMDMDDMVTIPVRRHMRMFDLRSVFRVVIEAEDAGALPVLRRRVVQELTSRHRGEEDVTVLTQDAMLDAFGNIIAVLTLLLAGLGGISLTVAGIGVMNVMLVTVSERTREIGLIKALGGSRQQVLGCFLAEAALLAGLGGIVGLVVAYAITMVLGVLYPAFPFTPPAWAAVAALTVSMSIGLAFGGWPARRASMLDPVAALNRR
jgi:putative ABC transport system permease protein